MLLAPYQDARKLWLAQKGVITTLVGGALGALNKTTYKAAWLSTAAIHWDAICCDDDPFAVVGNKAHLFRGSVLAAKTNKTFTTPAHPFFALAEAYLVQRQALEQSLFLSRCRLLQRLFIEGSAQLQTLKRSRQVVAFDDMLANVHERLHNPDYPELGASIRTRFPAALIDEFQDTDPLQLAIFKTIYDAQDPLVFLVGDPKQAIYSFRHADLHTYLRATRWAQNQWSLTHNQRSIEPLLAGLNAVFGANAAAFVLPDVQYRAVAYGSKPRAPLLDRSEKRAPLHVWRLPEDGGPLPKPDARRAAVTATAAEIARLLSDSAAGRIKLDDRELRPKDIAVLVRNRSLAGEMKRELARLRVGAVELSRDSIFGSAEARDWETVLTAIASPTRDSLLRAALATELFGCDAAEIEDIVADAQLLLARIVQFMEYRDLWVTRGFGIMYRQLLLDQRVARRLLARSDGERRLTNCLHVGEELQAAAESHPSPDALLRYFKAAQGDENPLDTAQLRLESDQNLVQIVTIHSCKGLEYPFVFCPFLCDGATPRGHKIEGREYHDEALNPVIDFDEYDAADPTLAAIKAQIKLESAAETVRLLYVALTRAVHRCYLVTGPYQTHSPKEEGAHSMLNWLAAGNGKTLEQWFDSSLSIQELDAAWQSVAVRSGGALVIEPLPRGKGTPLFQVVTDVAALTTPAPPREIPGGWRLSSYSGLSYGARSEHTAGDHDTRTVASPASAARPTDIASDDILLFPRGPTAGECIHAMFETIDFADPADWQRAAEAALAAHPQSRLDDAATAPTTALLAAMLSTMARDVTSAELKTGLQLSSIPRQRRLIELEFNLPVSHLSAAALNAALKHLGL